MSPRRIKDKFRATQEICENFQNTRENLSTRSHMITFTNACMFLSVSFLDEYISYFDEKALNKTTLLNH